MTSSCNCPIKKLRWRWKTCQTHLASITSVYKYLLSKQWFYNVIRPFHQIKSANRHKRNIFLIKSLSMLASPQTKTIKPPDIKKPGISDRSSFLRRRSVKFQFVWQKLCYNIPSAGLFQKHVGFRDLSAKYQKSFVCLRKMYLMVWKRAFYRNDDLSTTCQCRQLKLNPLSTQINIYCLMTNQTPALLVQRAPWTQAAVMLLQSFYFSRPPPPRAIIPDARLLGTSRW